MLKKLEARSVLLFVGAMLTVLFFIASQAHSVRAVTVTTDIPGSLVKGSMPDVYFVGTDNKRYVFPNEQVFHSWYADFSSVKTVTDEALAALPIAGNVTFKPGSQLIKIQSDPKVYAIDAGGTLRWISTEDLAKQLFGANWAKRVADVPVSDFANYQAGVPISSASDFDPTSVQQRGSSIGGVVVPPNATPGANGNTNTEPSANANVPITGSTGAFKIVSVDVVKADANGKLAEDVRTFKIVMSQPPAGARLTIVEKTTGAVYYSEPITNSDPTADTFYVFPSPTHPKLKPSTAYAWKVVGYAAPHATADQIAYTAGEFMTTDFTTTTPVTNTNTPPAGQEPSPAVSYQLCPSTTTLTASSGCCVATGGTFASASLPVAAGTLIRATSTPAVYYYATDGKRYIFPTNDVLVSWYATGNDLLNGHTSVCKNVKQLSDADIATISIGGSVDVRPGTFVLRTASDATLYVVARGRTLRKVVPNDLIETIYPGTYAQRIKTVPYLANYKMGADVTTAADYDPTAEYDWAAPNTMQAELSAIQSPTAGTNTSTPGTTPPVNTNTPTTPTVPTTPTTPPAGTVTPDASTAAAGFQLCTGTTATSQSCCMSASGSFPSASLPITSGSLIRAASVPAIYYYASNGQRYVFPSNDVLVSWYATSQEDLAAGRSGVCQNVKQLSDADIATIPIGGSVDMRPGTYALRTITDPTLYLVTRGQTIHKVVPNDLIQSIYPSSYSMLVRIVSTAQLSNYKIGTDITSKIQYNATLEYDYAKPNTLEAELGITAAASGT